jgi:hypothetical protein
MYTTEGEYTPPPPNGWYSSDTHSATPLPPDLLSFNYLAAFDEKGTTLVFNGSSVYKIADWSLVGVLQAPSNTFNYANAVLSPDGRRVNALTAHLQTGHIDRVSVYDTTRLQAGTSNLLLLGSIAVQDAGALCDAQYQCDWSGRFALDP